MSRKINKAEPLWFLPAPPKSPDYSTPEVVTARARQWLNGWAKVVYGLLNQDGKVYREFQTALRRSEAQPAPPEGRA